MDLSLLVRSFIKAGAKIDAGCMHQYHLGRGVTLSSGPDSPGGRRRCHHHGCKWSVDSRSITHATSDRCKHGLPDDFWLLPCSPVPRSLFGRATVVLGWRTSNGIRANAKQHDDRRGDRPVSQPATEKWLTADPTSLRESYARLESLESSSVTDLVKTGVLRSTVAPDGRMRGSHFRSFASLSPL